VDLRPAVFRRRSAFGAFSRGSISTADLAALLSGASRPYRNDLAESSQLLHTVLYCAVFDVDGIPPGIYQYDSARHRLDCVREGDVRKDVDSYTTSVKIYQLAVSFFPVGSYASGFKTYGDRWYRVQNMDAGIAVQRLCLIAATCGLSSQVTMAFDVDAVKLGFQLPPDWTPLCHVAAGRRGPATERYDQVLPL
jgi:SagB-type dehydrogenase family enzyme